jgi:hypothetical protein
MKQHTTRWLLCITIAASIYIVSCKPKNKISIARGEPMPTYSTDVKKILDEYCATTCHSSEKKKMGIDLSSYETSKEEAAYANFLGSIRHEATHAEMPANHKKPDTVTIQKIACWVNNGMPK